MLVQKHMAEDVLTDRQHDHVFRIVGSAERFGDHMMVLAVFFFRIRRVFFKFLYNSIVDFLIVHFFLISFHPFRGRNYLLQKAKERKTASKTNFPGKEIGNELSSSVFDAEIYLPTPEKARPGETTPKASPG